MAHGCLIFDRGCYHMNPNIHEKCREHDCKRALKNGKCWAFAVPSLQWRDGDCWALERDKSKVEADLKAILRKNESGVVKTIPIDQKMMETLGVGR